MKDWDAQTYDRVANPHVRWGASVLDRLDLRRVERVLDAGCGTGLVTEQLLTRMPRGEVIALDAAAVAWLEPSPAAFAPGEPFETFLALVLRPTLARLPQDDWPAFVHAVATRLPAPEVDYVRLNILARRSS